MYYTSRVDLSLLKEPGYYFPPISMAFLIDEKVKIVSREVYTFTDALSATGGFLGLIDIIIVIMIGRIQESMFLKSIIKLLFIEEENDLEANPKHKNESKAKLEPSKLLKHI